MHFTFLNIPGGVEAPHLIPAGERCQPETFEKPEVKNHLEERTLLCLGLFVRLLTGTALYWEGGSFI